MTTSYSRIYWPFLFLSPHSHSIGAVHDSRHVPCECVHTGAHVAGSLPRRRASNLEHLHPDAAECVVVSRAHAKHHSLLTHHFPPFSAIIITWLLVTTTAFPVFISHGEIQYYNHRNEVNTACLFLTDVYNLAAFQVW
jgi:hypothetical protein